MHIVGKMNKYIVQKLYLKNNQGNILMSANEIKMKFFLEKICIYL